MTACAGLLAGVAHADRDFSESEAEATRALLASVHGIDAAGADAITRALRSHATELSSVHRARFCRTLAALGDRDLRLHVLGLLLELAAADGEISHAEVITLRQIRRARLALRGASTEYRKSFEDEKVYEHGQVPPLLESIDEPLRSPVLRVGRVQQRNDDVGVENDVSHRRVVQCPLSRRRVRL